MYPYKNNYLNKSFLHESKLHLAFFTFKTLEVMIVFYNKLMTVFIFKNLKTNIDFTRKNKKSR